MGHATTGWSEKIDSARLRKILKDYAFSDPLKASIQLLNTLVPFLALWSLAAYFAGLGTWLGVFVSLPLSLANGLLLTRLFVLQHDCGHYSFFPAKKMNNVVGNLLSLFTFTPLYNWRREHNLHHAHIGNLDHMEHGDFWLLTTHEYAQLSAFKRAAYRLYRHPLVLFALGPFFYLLLRRRFPVNLAKKFKRERQNVQWTNAGLLLFYGALLWILGPQVLALVVLPTLFLGSAVCVYGFYVQHTYEGGYWQRSQEWDYFEAALRGSSYLDLPAWMQWATANISLHHIHHLEARIPNYHLQRCLKAHPELRPPRSLSLKESLRSLRLKLWDEERGSFASFER